jgi:hypothetical protein
MDHGIYIGMWINDKFHGHGKYKLNSGESYTGLWKDGKTNGIGVYKTKDGLKYKAIWNENGHIDLIELID